MTTRVEGGKNQRLSCRGDNCMRPVFGASFICALKFLDRGVARAIGGAVENNT